MSCSLVLESKGKAVVVKGDTRAVKDFLKEKGGSWNKGLLGWVYPGSKKGDILAALRAHPQVSAVDDKTGGGAPATASPASSAPASAAPACATSSNGAPTSTASGSQSSAQPAPQVAGEEGGVVFELGSNLFRITVSNFKGRAGVDIRKFYIDRDSGEVRPTQKGIWMKALEWEGLCKEFGKIDAASGAEETKIIVGADIGVTVKSDSVDVRRNYVDKADGELKPTKKGVMMTRSNWTILKGLATQIAQVLEDPPDSGPPKKKQRTTTEEESPKKASKKESKGDDDDPLSRKKLKKEIDKLLKGKDLSTVTLKSVRSELEAKLSLEAGSLEERKDEIKELVTAVIHQ